MKRRMFAVALVAGAVGFVAGNAFWYLASPLWIDRVVSEELPAELQMKVAAKGEFRDADSAHKGKGLATIFETVAGARVLRFTGFEATNGPDLEVWLVKASGPKVSADVTASQWLSLGRSKAMSATRTMSFRPKPSSDDYKSVVIWCEQFSVLFSAADLEPAS